MQTQPQGPSASHIYFLYAVGLMGLSLSSILTKWSEVPVFPLGFWRIFLAGVGLWTIVAIRDKRIFILNSGRDAWRVGLCSAFFFLHLSTYFFAAQNTTIAKCMIIFTTNPIWTSIASYYVFRERFSKKLAIAFLFGFSGVILLMSEGFLASVNEGSMLGDASALFSALFFAAYMLFSKKVRHSMNNLTFASTLFTFTGLLFFAASVLVYCFHYGNGLPKFDALAFEQTFFNYSPRSQLAIGLLILFPTYLGHLVMTRLMPWVTLGFMTCGKSIEPVIATFLAFFVFQEVPHLTHWLAFILSTISLIILVAAP